MKDDDKPPGKRAFNAIGFYSHAAEEALKLTQAKGSLPQLLTALKNKGVKQDEIDFSGVERALGHKPSVTPQELADFFNQAIPKIKPKYTRTPEYEEFALAKGQGGEGLAGTRYREHLLQLLNPSVNQHRPFETFHFGIPNVLMNFRTQDFAPSKKKSSRDADKDKVLLIDEMQSDWGQEGKKFGFLGESPKNADWVKEVAEKHYQLLKDLRDGVRARSWSLNHSIDQLGNVLRTQGIDDKKIEGYIHSMSYEPQLPDKLPQEVFDQARAVPRGYVPVGPYVRSTEKWSEMGLKYLIKKAVDEGKTHIVWTPSEIQEQRYPFYQGASSGKRFLVQHDPVSGLYKLQYSGYPQSADPRDEEYEYPFPEYPSDFFYHPEQLRKLFEPRFFDRLMSNDPNAQIVPKNPLPDPAFEGHNFYKYHAGQGGDDEIEMIKGSKGMELQYDQVLPRKILALAKMHDPDAELTEYDGPHEDINGFPALRITPKMAASVKANGFKAFRQGGEVGNVNHALRVARKAKGGK